jgi:leader peptidase (prepilin peptidase) / N-methyltransferase
LSLSLAFVGVVGLFIGLIIDRAIRRLPLEKSMVWPIGEYCEHCLQPKPWYSAVPLLGWFLVGGRCASCRTPLPSRGVLIQLLTAAGFMGLYFLHIGLGGRELPSVSRIYWFYGPNELFALFVFHCLLFSFLLAATFTDLDYTLIPLSITAWGSLLALLIGTFWYIEVRPIPLGLVGGSSKYAYLAVHPGQWFEETRWKDWFGGRDGNIPAWAEWFRSTFYWHWMLNWTKYLGFATGVAGWIVGYSIIWIVRWVCTKAFGKEAMGIGDLDLLAMIGAFLGWQTAVIAFIMSWGSGILLALPAALIRRGQAMPFGPHLAIGAMIAVVFWKPLWWYFEPALYDAQIFFVFTMAMIVLLAATAFGVNMVKRLAFRTMEAAGKG